MAKKTSKNYWFKPKRYGWGWGMPQTKEGWFSFGVFIVVWLLALSVVAAPVSNEDEITRNLLLFTAIMLINIAGLLYVSFKYGEPPKWRWGKKK